MPAKGYRKPEDQKKRKGEPRIQTVQIYMGQPEIRDARLARLDSLAAAFGVNRSQLIQMIGDGKITLTLNQ